MSTKIHPILVVIDTCKVRKEFKDLIHHCRSDYGWMDDDTSDYLPVWTPLPPDNETIEDLLPEDSPWVRTSPFTTLIGNVVIFCRDSIGCFDSLNTGYDLYSFNPFINRG